MGHPCYRLFLGRKAVQRVLLHDCGAPYLTETQHMSDDNDKPRGSHDYAKHQSADTRKEAKLAAQEPVRRTPFLIKLIGFVLLCVVAWWGWHSYTAGKIIDLTDEKQQQEALNQVNKDLAQVNKDLAVAADKTREASVQAIDWARSSLGDLEKLIKGKPPQTNAEIKELVDESKLATDKEKSAAPAPGPVVVMPETSKPVQTIPQPPPGPIADAQAEYRLGQDAYAKTDPMAPHDQVQKFIRVAEPHFSRCLDLLEAARKRGVNGAEIDQLEQASARRLYDCRKRMELHP